MKIFEFCKIARQEKQLSLLALSQRSSISYSMLYRFEEGDIPDPHPHLLHKISVALQLPYLKLMQLAGYLNDEDFKNPPFKPSASALSLPLFNWASLAQLSLESMQCSLHAPHQINPDPAESKTCFAVKLSEASFEPLFLKNSMLSFIVYNATYIREATFVLYRCLNSKEPSLAKTILLKSEILFQDLRDHCLYQQEDLEIMALLYKQTYT